jgi:hypothetical protein
MEITNESRGWHVHFHLLVDADWIDQQTLAVQWGKLVDQDYAIVKVKDCREVSYLQEVTKYAVKPAQLLEWPGNELCALIDSVKGTRMFGAFGSCFKDRSKVKQLLADVDATKPDNSKCPQCGGSDTEVHEFKHLDQRV